MRVRHRACPAAILGPPLVRSGWTLRQLPFELKEVLEEVVAPLRRRLRPGHFQPAADGVRAKALAKFIFPAKALVLNVSAFRLRSHVVGWHGSAMSFAEGVPASNQGDCLFVVHGHAPERFANVPARRNRIGLAIRT